MKLQFSKQIEDDDDGNGSADAGSDGPMSPVEGGNPKQAPDDQ